MGLGGVHHRQLPAFHRVAGVGVDLVHHLDQRIAAGDEHALLAIGGEAHVAGIERQGLGRRHRFLAGALHIEGGLSLPLLAVHAVVEGAHQQHRPEAADQQRGLQPGIPIADRLALVVQHPDQAVGEIMGLFRRATDVRPWQRPRRRDLHDAQVDGVARPPGGLGNVQAERDGVLHPTSFRAVRH